MLKSGKIINRISISLTMLISILFTVRLIFITELESYIVAPFTIIGLILIFNTDKFKYLNHNSSIFRGISAFIVLAVTILNFAIGYNSEQVIGYSFLRIIDDFIKEMNPNTVNISEAYPFIEIFNIKFYSIGLVTIAKPIAIALYLLFIHKYSINFKEFLIRYVLVILTPVIYFVLFYYNITFLETIINIWFIYYAYRNLDFNVKNKQFYKYLFLSILILTFTSPLSLFSILILFGYKLKTNLKNGLTFILYFLLTGITLEVIGNLTNIDSLGVIGTNDLGMFLLPGFYFIALFLGWCCTDIQEIFFSTGMFFIFLYIIAGIFLIILSFNKSFNIDYSEALQAVFIILLFLTVSVKDYKVDRYLGKIYPKE